MRLIKVCLSDSVPFWFFNEEIRLNPNSRVSNLFNLDKLNNDDKERLNADISRGIVKAFDKDGTRIIDINKHNIVGGGISSDIAEDIEIEEDEMPEIISVTCSDDSEEEDEEIKVTEEDREEANIILAQNGNTARKTIYSFKVGDNNIGIIIACLEIESEDRNRKGIIKACNEQIEAYHNV